MSTSRFIRWAQAPFALVLFVLALLMAVVPATARVPHAAAPDFAAIDAYVESERQAMGTQGMVLAIVQGNQIVHLKGFGQADPAGRAVTPETPFDIASLNKSMIALAVMQLVEAGKAELDAPVQRYIPWFRVADATASAHITLRHLLNQTSGLPKSQNFAVASSLVADDNAREQRVRALRTVTLAHEPGTVWAYVTDNFVTLTLVIEKISGQTYDAYMREHVFGPLGMDQTFTSQDDARQHGLATGYQSWFGRARPVTAALPPGLVSASIVYSSAEDMARYLLLYLNHGRLGEAQLLSSDGVHELFQPAIPTDDDAFYGMGWDVGEMNGIPIVSHTGTGADFWARMILHPGTSEEDGWGIVALINQRALQQIPRTYGMVDGVVAMLQGNPPPAGPANLFMLLYRGIMALAALELIGVGWSARVLRRWWQQPARRPRRGWLALLGRVAVPVGLHALVALIFLIVLPSVIGARLGFIVAADPDMGYMMAMGGGLALGWSIIHTLVAIALLRPHRASVRAASPLPA